MCHVTETQSSYIYHSLSLNQLKGTLYLKARPLYFSYTSVLLPSSATLVDKIFRSIWKGGGENMGKDLQYFVIFQITAYPK